VEKLLKKFTGLRVLVYGDYVLDEFLYGEIERISREAPVFIVSHERSDFRPGCAANTVANLAALGAAAVPCGIIGEDDYGINLRKTLSDRGISTVNLISSPDNNTALKTRVIAGGAHSIKQQIVRIDRLNNSGGDKATDALVKERMEAVLKQCDAVLISDYGIGGLKPELGTWLVKVTREAGKPVLVDSRYRLQTFTGATASTPNQPEAERCLGIQIESVAQLHAAGLKLLGKLDMEALVITRGGEGMTVFRKDRDPVDIPAYGDEEVVDVTGAGDTVIAAFTLGVAAGAGFVEAATVANVAGGLSVLKKGTCSVTREEILNALKKNPV
jgi:rfaE bifunctional protein kinase chain/domain